MFLLYIFKGNIAQEPFAVTDLLFFQSQERLHKYERESVENTSCFKLLCL